MRRYLLPAALVAAFAALASCGPSIPKPFLTVYGAKVKIVKEAAVAMCSPLGGVQCRYVWDDTTVKNQEYTCTVDLQNQAAENGASHLVLDPPLIKPDVILNGRIYRCD
ncbi:MAG: hypothetical protein FJ098_12155 [Deltaproteobacteria bacterium]|nr:hypothetical protein [Deltaproteobacteria bacterium]